MEHFISNDKPGFTAAAQTPGSASVSPLRNDAGLWSESCSGHTIQELLALAAISQAILSAMQNGKHINTISFDVVNNPIILFNNFTNLLETILRDFSAGKGEIC
jgi:hypothetical protein